MRNVLEALEAEPAIAAEDPALLALGQELERLQSEWKASLNHDREIDNLINSRAKEITGIDYADAVSRRDADDTADSEYWKVVADLYGSTPGTDPEGTSWDKLHEQLGALCESIFAVTARTRRGLAIQATAATMVRSDLWWRRDPEALSPEGQFMEAICRSLGVLPWPATLPA
jgi:hypothetical protein